MKWPVFSHKLPSTELTYLPDKAYLKMSFLFPQVGYVSFLEGTASELLSIQNA